MDSCVWLAISPELDGKRKGFLLRFLYESGLISVSKPIITLGGSILGVDDSPDGSDDVVRRRASRAGGDWRD